MKLVLLLALFSIQAAEAKVVTRNVEYRSNGTVLEGYLAYDDAAKGKRPGVLVVHEWTGIVDYTRDRARQLAELGYVAFAADIYGKGIRPKPPEEAGKVATQYMSNRMLLRERAAAGLSELKKQPNVDSSRVAAIGYCFGGTTVLELARSGADLKGVGSFHGQLNTPNPADAKNIKAKVVVFHGAEDKLVPKKDIEAFEQEMRSAKVDFSFIEYANALHSFTNPYNRPPAGMPGVAEYNEVADRRSWAALLNYFHEWFQ
jgi:dienelactone hydrolase